MSNKEASDTHFFNSFSLVLGILIFISIVLFVWARKIGHEQEENQLSESQQLGALRENIEPFARVAIAGKDNSALVALDAPKAAPAAMEVPKTGEAAYTAVCSACHAQGINGAPKSAIAPPGGRALRRARRPFISTLSKAKGSCRRAVARPGRMRRFT